MDIIKEQQIEAMRKIVYFTFNFNPNWIREAFPDNYAHLSHKFDEYHGDVCRFFVELDTDKQFRMMEYVLENYQG